jgi:hypothetical protein
MTYIQLLGQRLKDDDVIEVLERDDLEVTYSFDRLHEGQPDRYWVAAESEGVQMHFNEHQVLDTLFFYIEADEGFSPCAPESLGTLTFKNLEQAKAHATASELSFKEGATDLFGVPTKWIRMEFDSYSHHSEFRSGRLHRIAAMLASTQ